MAKGRRAFKLLRTHYVGMLGRLRGRRPRSGSAAAGVPACLEPLEPRVLLSSQLPKTANPPDTSLPVYSPILPLTTDASSGATPSGITPAQMRVAYGLNEVTFGTVVGDGQGQTIALIDAYNDPNAASDLNAFNQYFDLQQMNQSGGPTFKVVNQTGGSSLPTDAAVGGWGVEISLDIEWAHVVAPDANIILFEANSDSGSDLNQAVNTARDTPGVSVVSMSYSSPEGSYELSEDSMYTTPSGHEGVTFVAATGDDGEPAGYPAFSPNVVAVGGTTLTISATGAYEGETGWSGSGGGISEYEPQPAYQNGVVTQSTTMRTTPDVAMDADPNTGVPVYDTYDLGTTDPWEQVGGTSLATPMFAGVIAIMDQGRVVAGEGTLDGPSQTLPQIYSVSESDFHDITSGNNGYPAGPGYDLVTGRGSPVVPKLVGAFTVVGPAAAVSFVQQPSNTTLGTTIVPPVTVDVEDANGNLVTTNASAVTLSIASGASGTLEGTLTVAAVDGVATFTNLSFTGAGTFTLEASDGNLTSATSDAFTVAGPAAQLAFVQQPTGAAVGAAVSPAVTVEVEDANGNLVTNANSSITLALASGPAGAVLAGTLTEPVEDGEATFTDLSFPASGTYTLEATDGALTGATSAPVTISPDYGLHAVALFDGANGSVPEDNLIADSQGNLYGTTGGGGDAEGDGTVFEIAAGSNAITTLALFNGTSEGGNPAGDLLMDSEGNLYGTTTAGGSRGVGTVFELPAGSSTITTLASFNGSDGSESLAGLVMDSHGDLFGTAYTGGNFNGDGTVFEVAAGTRAITLVARFDGANGANPVGDLVMDSQGDLYGTTSSGGDANGDGTVFEVGAGTHAITTLAEFDSADGANPECTLLMDSSGNLYGTAAEGGADGDGTVFELAAGSGTITTLANFDGADGANPVANVVMDGAGNLYGTTYAGGDANGDGTVFELPAGSNVVTPLGFFNAATTGANPFSSVVMDGGVLYGTTSDGGDAAGDGGVFRVAPVGIAAQVAFVSQPGSTPAGQTITPPVTVAIEDANGDTVLTDSSTVTLAISTGPSGGTLDGTISVAAHNGVATFTDLSLPLTGDYTLTATDGSLTPGTSATFAVTGPGTQLVFVQQPTGSFAGTPISPPVTVDVEDANGNLATNDDSSVTLAIASGPAGSQIEGQVTVTAQDGVATFSDVALSEAGTFTLRATDAALTAGVSASFTVLPSYAIQAVASFNGAGGGANPYGGLVVDSKGDLFGTAGSGGDAEGDGTIFEIAAGSTAITTIAQFNGTDGADPVGDLLIDSKGDLFGTAATGGNFFGDGTIFEVAAGTGTITTLALFEGTNGASPNGGLVMDSKGDLFGTASAGGNLFGDGTVFELPAGSSTITALALFNGANGATPLGGILMDSKGNLYGTASAGGDAQGDGTVFELPSGSSTITALALFNGADGSSPGSTLVRDSSGNLYGTAYTGGDANGDGTVFELPAGSSTLTALALFNGANGSNPIGGLLLDSQGDLFGTASGGGDANADGTAFEVVAGSGTISPLALFNGTDGSNPAADLVTAPSGTIYGTTFNGGADSSGTVFALTVTHLVFTQQPGNVTAGADISPSVTVAVENASGNIITSDDSDVTIAIGTTTASGSPVLNGTLTAQAHDGVATFANLALDSAGTYTLTATDGTDQPATSTPFNVSPAAAAQLVFIQQPTGGAPGLVSSPAIEVAIEDQYGNLETTNTSTVTLGITSGSGPSGATISGTLSVAATAGVATFTNVSLTTPGSYTLAATDGALTAATSDALAILDWTWTDVTNPVPAGDGANVAILLSDGTVMVHGGGTQASATWYLLAPDTTGGYIDAQWTKAATMTLARLDFPANVLPTGQVFVAGGEYTLVKGVSTQTWTDTAEIYDPATDVWNAVTSDPLALLGDVPTEVLPDGNVLVGDYSDNGTYIYDPTTDTWTAGPAKINSDNSQGESWLKLPNGSILNYDTFASITAGAGEAELYVPSTNQWVTSGTGTLPLLSTNATNGDWGVGVVLPDGEAYLAGADGATAFYDTTAQTWSAGPTLPDGLGAGGPAAVLPNGDVLLALSPQTTAGGTATGPTSLYEFDPTTGTYTNVTPPAGVSNTSGNASVDEMLVLPTGQVMLTNSTGQIAIFTPGTPGSAPQSSWRPTITSVVSNGADSYTLTGTQLTGLDEGAYNGANAEMSSNYPIIRVIDSANGNVLYATTTQWNSTGVGASSAAQTVQFTLPATLGSDPFTIEVVANGITSASFSIAAPIAAVSGDGQTIVDGSVIPSAANATNFGIVAPGSGTVDETYTVTNNGTVALTLGTPSVPSGFVLVSGPTSSVNPGASTTFTVGLPETTPGTFTGDVSLVTNDLNNDPFTFAIAGTVTTTPEPAAVVTSAPGGQAITDGSTTTSAANGTAFGAVVVGSAAVDETYTIANNGTAALTVGTPTLPAGFTLVSAPGASVNPGSSTTFTVALATTTVGTFSGNVSFADNDPNQDPFTFAIAGSVTATAAPAATVTGNGQMIADGATTTSTANATAFGSVAQGAASPQETYTIANNGSVALTVGTVTLPDAYTLITAPASSVAAGSTTTFTVALTTTDEGTFAGQVSFATNDPANNPYTFAITGTVTPAEVQAAVVTGHGQTILNAESTPTAANGTDFGSAIIGAPTIEETYTITDAGNAALTIGTVSLPDGFTLVTAPATSIPAGGMTTFTVGLETGTLGTFAGQVSFATSDPDNNPYAFAITGTINAVPITAVGALSTSAGTTGVIKGDTLTLTASDVTTAPGASVKAVDFYLGLPSGGGVFGTKTVKLLGKGKLVDGSYVLTIATGSLTVGPETFFARVLDSKKDYSAAVSATATVLDDPPTVKAVEVSKPAHPVADAAVTLKATGVTDKYNTVTSVTFYWSPSGETTTTTGAVSLGTATPKSGWKLTVTLPSASDASNPFPTTGDAVFLAQATDKSGTLGNIASVSVAVAAPADTEPAAARALPGVQAPAVVVTAGDIAGAGGAAGSAAFWVDPFGDAPLSVIDTTPVGSGTVAGGGRLAPDLNSLAAGRAWRLRDLRSDEA